MGIPQPLLHDLLISIHAPRVGSDLPSSPQRQGRRGFQSTLPVWGAAWTLHSQLCQIVTNFNPRSPCGERPRRRSTWYLNIYFNPRSPCGERHKSPPMQIRHGAFQSTLPVWGATLFLFFFFLRAAISIHAPRVGSDWVKPIDFTPDLNFNPRSPCGERLCRDSTLYSGRAYFNPRSPCGERLRSLSLTHPRSVNFNPRSPCGERLEIRRGGVTNYFISIHAPRVGSDCPLEFEEKEQSNISIHAPRVGSDDGRLTR